MTLVAGALGLLVLAVGLVADATRADVVAVPASALKTSVVVIGPEVLALAPEGRVAVTSDGALVASAARPVDTQEWLSDLSATHVTGLTDWETLRVRTSDRVAPQDPVVTPSPEPTVGATPSPEPTDPAAATPTPVAEGEPTQADADAAPSPSTDHWRATWRGNGRVSIAIADVPAGMPLVVQSADGSPLTDVSMRIERQLNDAWISPLIWWGGILTVLGLVAALFLLIDLRPVQERAETWVAHRRRGASTAASIANPGSRRARRATGDAMPVADLGEESTAGKKARPTGDDSTSTKEDRS
ncbi:MAG: hypothetical protein CVT64_10200 [Actinobacteria bacterium HGW-Actinobacteria-4]|nr:MAG: hypothetical protein CVT64_10200 [Actinobacteria bacterium HGW-Actinobacteria-4]